MRKVIAAIIAVLILSVPGVALAQMEKSEGMMDDKGMEMKGGCPMMKHMMGPMVIPTSDGGVVVVTGNKMTKYDQDLDVIGQAEIKMDMDAMKMMKEEAAEPSTGTEPTAATEPAAEVIPEAAEPVAVAEPAAEMKPEAAAEPAVVIEPAAEVKPSAEEPAAVRNSTVPVEEGNDTTQK